MQSATLKALIRTKAEDHGFSLCHVSRPEIGAHHRDALQQWVEAGMMGEMGWMGEVVRLERRKQPATMLEGVRSVISVAMRYTPPAYSLTEAVDAKGSGVITAYAHGDDYHEIMKRRLRALALELDQLIGVHDQRIFVDTAPVLEHALAENGGLGWQGKHSLTIHRELGSWFLLGEIFTTAEIEPDQPASNHCGSCSRCIECCPTGAIIAPYVVDARRCISYLTIEYDGFIPEGLRAQIGNRIYGCDDCQMVCPWNSHADKLDADIADHLNPKGENNLPNLASLLQLDEEMFRQRFRRSAIKRTKRRGLLRNVCVAMGNSGLPGFIPVLMSALRDSEPLIRGHAAWALARLCDGPNRSGILAALLEQQADENDTAVLDEISSAINDIRGVV